MTAVYEADPEVAVATEEDAVDAAHNALAMAGCSLEELTRQAASGSFQSLDARLAWMVLADLS